MFNALFGNNIDSVELLHMINLTPEDVGRYRDCYLSKDGQRIIVYTRNGGGNREEYGYVFENLSTHPNYITDYDDNFDCTYASIEFSIPEQYKDRVAELFKTADTTTGSEKFQNLFKAMEDNPELAMANPRVQKVTEGLAKVFEEPKSDINMVVVNPDGTVETR